MSDETAVVASAPVAVETVASVKRERSESVPVALFISTIFAAAKAGLTNADVAKQLGMKVQSFSVRKSQINKNPPASIVAEFAKVNKVFKLPALKDGRNGGTATDLSDLGKDLLAQMAAFDNAENTENTETGEAAAPQ